LPDYENKIRVRACGLLIENQKILLAELLSPISKEMIWIPPGGGIKFGEKLRGTVKREFFEETSLTVQVKELLHLEELILDNFHVVEFYYRVEKISGELALGGDPEYTKEEQILKSLAFKSKEEIKELKVTPDYIKNEFWEEIESE